MSEASAYTIVTSSQNPTYYVKFSDSLEKTSAEEIEKLEEELKNESQAKVYIFDLSNLVTINRKCYRPLALAQHCARNKFEAQVVIIPPNLEVKKLLIEEGLIRPNEICPSLNKVASFVKNKMEKK